MTAPGPALTFLTVEDVLSLHDQAADIYDIAAAYAYHLAQNQPFLDGNKRAGLAAAAAFLFVNGIDLLDQDGDVDSVLAKAMIDVAEKRWPEPRRALADVLRRLSAAR